MLFKEDIVKKYSQRRKNFPEDEVSDLLNCLLKFIKSKVAEKGGETYAIELPSFLTLYKEYEGNEDQLFLEKHLYNAKAYSGQKRYIKYYTGKTKEEMEYISNNHSFKN